MKFEWDPAKSAANLEKHGISFEDAVRIFGGPTLTQVDHRQDYGEKRELTLGAVPPGDVVLLVVHTDRSGVTRIISARHASRRERKVYHDHLEEKS